MQHVTSGDANQATARSAQRGRAHLCHEQAEDVTRQLQQHVTRQAVHCNEYAAQGALGGAFRTDAPSVAKCGRTQLGCAVHGRIHWLFAARRVRHSWRGPGGRLLAYRIACVVAGRGSISSTRYRSTRAAMRRLCDSCGCTRSGQRGAAAVSLACRPAGPGALARRARPRLRPAVRCRHRVAEGAPRRTRRGFLRRQLRNKLAAEVIQQQPPVHSLVVLGQRRVSAAHEHALHRGRLRNMIAELTHDR